MLKKITSNKHHSLAIPVRKKRSVSVHGKETNGNKRVLGAAQPGYNFVLIQRSLWRALWISSDMKGDFASDLAFVFVSINGLAAR